MAQIAVDLIVRRDGSGDIVALRAGVELIGGCLIGVEQAAKQALAVVSAAAGDLIAVAGEDGIRPLAP